MTVAVYSRPSCVQCMATYRALDSKGIDYEVIDLSRSPGAADKVRALGYLQAPVVIADDDQWSGFRPDKIAELAARLTEPLGGALSGADRHVPSLSGEEAIAACGLAC
ncbi:glutaredoxin-like protein NrdH [Propionibacterium cyclohexanicum]|uniref:Glutaredoxin-like protein NrdH n=1 Tax=Propionibacterium cyclohexanicum TaxID=64702 RepID=A0A1H9U4T2_9ACTN|nr:glutaredoxin-like protein NrdH [Propionibacterium cyclohexanicum]SES04177.1 glutaredoxin-like protein NrdH [Propionibacterium cyclohexanicum]